MACTFSASELFNIALKCLSTSASVAGILILLRSAAGEFILDQLKSIFAYLFQYLIIRPCTKLTHVINEFIIRPRTKLTFVIHESGRKRNQVYDAAVLYLPTKITPKTRRLSLSKTEKQPNFDISIDSDEEIVECFEGIQLKWRYKCIQRPPPHGSGPQEKKFFELSFDYRFKHKVEDSYLPHVLVTANQMKNDSRVIKIYNWYRENGGHWGSMVLEHPATFDKVAMDPKEKNMIIDDLKNFVDGKNFYNNVGKAWKRGYLLYGPPGTGKSTLIAAMANHLKFDVYDVELASINSNSDLRKLLLLTTNKSIIVIEDIDCSIQVPDREYQLESDKSDERLTLSGILNFIDGLWSSCGDEKIIVFTTNDKDKLDAALLRPGRMDRHIKLSYCTPFGFRFLAEKYLGIKDHELFGEIGEVIGTKKVTPAEVAEQLMRNNNDPDPLLRFIEFLEKKKSENEEAEAKKNRAQQESTASEGGQN